MAFVTSHINSLYYMLSIVLLLGVTTAPARCTIQPFDLADVKLASTTAQSRAATLNLEYLFMVEPDRLLWSFRNNAGIDAPSSPYDSSWEDRNCELRGHFTGHYLSALALAYRATGDAGVLTRINYLVDSLSQVQTALGKDGYLSAFPEEFFDRLQGLQPVWAPYYTIHKIMAGLMDAYQLAGNDLAFDVVKQMAKYFLQRISLTLAVNGTDHWHQMLNNEFGGMNDVMYRMYEASANPEHLYMGTLFDKPAFWQPLVHGADPLPGLHANTHLAQVNGFVSRWGAMRDDASQSAVSSFFNIVTTQHSYATGGNNDHEYWGQPNMLADTLLQQNDATETQETCTQYNMLKIARSLFTWTGDVSYADYYERALLNGIMGVMRLPGQHHDPPAEQLEQTAGRSDAIAAVTVSTYERRAAVSTEQEGQKAAYLHHDAEHSHHMHLPRRPDGLRDGHEHDDSPGPGVYLYLLPLGTGQGKGDSTRRWGTPEHAFWCCYGTAVESFAKLHDSVYFRDVQPPAGAPRLYINQYVSSSVSWTDVKAVLTMTADMYAPGPSAKVTLHVSCEDDVAEFAVMLRVPSWVGPAPSVHVNGMMWDACPGLPVPGYCQVSRRWSTGDRLDAVLPMRYWLKELPESRPEYQSLQAVMMGPFVMAGLTHDIRDVALESSDIERAIEEPAVDNAVSLQAAWDSSLFVRHDQYHMYMSRVRNTDDGIDSAFSLRRGLCQPAGPQHQGGSIQAASSADDTVLLESLNLPGFFIGFDDRNVAVLSQSGANSTDFCKRHALLLRPGLQDNTSGLFSLEARSKPGFFLSAYKNYTTLGSDPERQCLDMNPRCAEWAAHGECEKNPGYMMLQCRRSCNACDTLNSTLTMQPLRRGSLEFALTSSFLLTAPRATLPQGAKILKGTARQYVLAPLSNLVDERYTAYFNISRPQMTAEQQGLLESI